MCADPTDEAQERIRELERTLESDRAAFVEFLEYLPIAMVEVDIATQRVTMINRLGRIVLGHDPEGSMYPEGMMAGEIVTDEERVRLAQATAELIAQGMQPDGTYRRTGKQEILETVGRRRDGSTFPAEIQASFVLNEAGQPVRSRITFRDISERKAAEAERERLLSELQEALASVRTLRGLLPICAWCRKVRADDGYWSELEAYVAERSHAQFSHGICPECMRQFETGQEPRGKG